MWPEHPTVKRLTQNCMGTTSYIPIFHKDITRGTKPQSRSNNLGIYAALMACEKCIALQYRHSSRNTAKDCVFAIQVLRWCVCDEKLAPIGVGPTVCHGQNPSARVFELLVDFVRESWTVYRSPSSSGACGVTTENHARRKKKKQEENHRATIIYYHFV